MKLANRFKTDLPRELRQLLAEEERTRKEAWKHIHGSRSRCFYCGRPLNENKPSRENTGRRSVDHLVPASRGGANCPTNYVFCCAQCNQLKAQLTLEEFRAALRVIMGEEPVFFGERKGGQHWNPPKPLICVRARNPMIAQMERTIIERFAPFLPADA